MRKFLIEDGREAWTDTVCGYVVLALEPKPDTEFDPDLQGCRSLAFCAPLDVQEHKWSRDTGIELCDRRKAQLVSGETVRECVANAILEGHDYIPQDLRDGFFTVVDTFFSKRTLKRPKPEPELEVDPEPELKVDPAADPAPEECASCGTTDLSNHGELCEAIVEECDSTDWKKCSKHRDKDARQVIAGMQNRG